MKISKVDESRLEAANRPIFSGTVKAHGLVSGQVNIGVVQFAPNSRTTWHTHSGEQILYIVDGQGVLANDEGEHVVTPGTAIHVTVGERHWHGGTKETGMTHLSIMPQGSQTEVLDEVTNPGH